LRVKGCRFRDEVRIAAGKRGNSDPRFERAAVIDTLLGRKGGPAIR
jgi:hypothetical protein